MKNTLIIIAILLCSGCIMKANEIDIDPEFGFLKSAPHGQHIKYVDYDGGALEKHGMPRVITPYR